MLSRLAVTAGAGRLAVAAPARVVVMIAPLLTRISTCVPVASIRWRRGRRGKYGPYADRLVIPPAGPAGVVAWCRWPGRGRGWRFVAQPKAITVMSAPACNLVASQGVTQPVRSEPRYPGATGARRNASIVSAVISCAAIPRAQVGEHHARALVAPVVRRAYGQSRGSSSDHLGSVAVGAVPGTSLQRLVT
jgi:hypothetical protein